MTRQLDVKPRHREQIERLLREHLPGVAVWAYGSRVNGRSHEGSDLDLVLRGPNLVKIDTTQLAAFNEAVQESTIPFLIEARDWARLPESFHREIEREYVVLVADSEAFEARPVEAETEWIEATIEDIVAPSRNALVGGPFGSNLVSRDYVSEGVPVIRGQNMGSRWIAGDFVFVTPQKAKSLEANLARPSDIILTQRGTLGQVSLVPSASFKRYLVSQSQMKVTVNREIADPLFFYYVLSSAEQQAYVRQNAIQTGVPHTNLGILRATPVPVPPLNEQRAIAHILGTLDDKIECNRRMNATLEAMARTLFKSWFIDFDPVHAKAALRRHAAAPITPPLGGSRQAQGDSPPARRWGVARRHYPRRALPTARTLRQPQTDAEALLWYYLRDKQLDGYKFRRQHPIGPYIVDFACLSRKVLIELDGGHHAEQREQDEARDRFLRNEGYRVLRFWNNEVFENCGGVLEAIRAAVQDPPPQPSAPDGLPAATPPQGGSDWSVERARAYLDGMDPGVAALFPDRFEDSELGEVPVGWEETTLEKIAVLNPETWTARDAPQTVVYVDLSNTKWGTIEKCETYEWKDAPSRAKRVLRIGDTILGTVRPGNGSYAFIGEDGLTGSTGFAVLRPKAPRDRALVWCCATASENIDRLTHLADGAAYPAVRPQVVSTTRIVLSSEGIRNAFATICEPFLSQMEANKRETRILAALRDTLLPRLISGELRVGDSKCFVASTS